MKLKLVVASMSVLGLLSGAVFAADEATTTTTTTTTAAPHAKKVVKHHTARKHVQHHVDYKSEGGFAKAQPAEVTVLSSKVDQLQATVDAMNRNTKRSTALPDWFQRVQLSGGMNIDGHWGQRNLGYSGENTRQVSLNDVFLNLDAKVNNYVSAFIGTSYGTQSSDEGSGGFGSLKGGEYSDAYRANSFTVEQAYITAGNLDQYPVYVKLGKQFLDYGSYNIHPITRSMTQVMSESLQTAADVGVISNMGFHGSAAIFDNSHARQGSIVNGVRSYDAHTPVNFNVTVGYDHPDQQLGYGAGVGYLYNITGANDIGSMVPAYVSRVSAMAIYGNVNSGPFSLVAHFTPALQTFNSADLHSGNTNSSGAKPWAADVQGGYSFNGFNLPNNVYLGYQQSGDAVNLALPKHRYVAGYNVDVWTHTNVGLEFTRDNDYNSSDGGTGKDSDAVAGRVSVMFG